MTDIETVSVKAEHLVEGMIVLRDLSEWKCERATVNRIIQHPNPYGPDDIQVEFQDPCHLDMWTSLGETVEVEA
jgi:hypothetical protein